MTGDVHFSETSTPLFSVIVPAYNAGRYLEECLSSVAEQTFRRFELIVVDDGSTDDTAEILENFARGHGSMVVIPIYQRNRGRFAARRAALEIAAGDYVVFLDADDALKADALQVLSEEVERTHVNILAFGMADDSGFEHPRFCEDLPFGDYAGQSYGLVKQATLRGRFNNVCGKAISLAAFDLDADYSSHFGLMHGEDLFQLLPVIDKACSCTYIDRALYYYRRHEGSSTMSYKPRQLDDLEVAVRRLLEYGEKWGMPRDAAFGALWNICCTVKTLLKDPSSVSIRNTELRRFAAAIEKLGLAPYTSSQRVDNRLILRAVLSGKGWIACGAVRVLEFCKGALSR